MLRQSNNIAVANGFYWNGATMTSSNEGFAVQLDTTGNVGAVKLATAGSTNIGIIPNSNLYANGDPIEIINSVGMVVDTIAGSANFSAGDLLKTDSTGALITAGSTDAWFAQALETATSGNKGQVMIMAGGSIASNVTFTRTGTQLNPTTAHDTVATGPSTNAGAIQMTDNTLAATGVGSNVDLLITTKGTGVAKVNAVPVVTAVVTPVQATTGTGGTVGRITNASVTTSSVIIVCGAEAAAKVAYVIASAGYFTVYDDSAAAISGAKINYMITSY